MTDRYPETYALRVSHKMKVHIEALSPMWKKKLNHEIRLTIARILHEADFDPYRYMDRDEDDERARHIDGGD